MATFKASYNISTYHKDWSYFAFSNVKFLPDNQQVELKLFRTIKKERKRAFEEGFEGGPKRQ